MITGDRIAWWAQPKRQKGRCTGSILGLRESERTGTEFVVEGDPTGTQVIVRPENNPVLLRTVNELKEGQRVRFPATEEFEVMEGRVHTPFADGVIYIFLEKEQDISEVPCDPNDEVEMIP